MSHLPFFQEGRNHRPGSQRGAATAGVLALVACSGVFFCTGRALQELSRSTLWDSPSIAPGPAVARWGWLSELGTVRPAAEDAPNPAGSFASNWKPFYTKRFVRRTRTSALARVKQEPKAAAAAAVVPAHTQITPPAPAMSVRSDVLARGGIIDLLPSISASPLRAPGPEVEVTSLKDAALTLREVLVENSTPLYREETVVLAPPVAAPIVQVASAALETPRSVSAKRSPVGKTSPQSPRQVAAREALATVARVDTSQSKPSGISAPVETGEFTQLVTQWAGLGSETKSTLPAATVIMASQMDSHPEGGVTTQLAQMTKSVASPLPEISVLLATAASKPEVERVVISQSAPQRPAVVAAPSCSYPYVEAMGWSFAVPGAWHETITREDAVGAGWQLVRAQGHWPSANYALEDHAACWSAIADNTVQQAAKSLDVSVQKGMGVIYGQLAPGWTVSIAGRPLSHLYWGPQTDVNQPRSFVWLNVPPGVAQVTYTNELLGASGSVVLPVESDQATVADLRNIREVVAQGRVLDGSRKSQPGIAHASVHAIHHPKGMTSADTQGVFSLPHLWVAGDYPVYFETLLGGDHWPHRYLLPLAALPAATLYRVSDAQVMDWLGQLKDGTSPETALIVGSVTAATLTRAEGELQPKIAMSEAAPSLQPEVYALTADGELQPARPLLAKTNRFLMVQVPEGPARVVLQNARGISQISQHFYHSKGYVSLMGPY